VPWSVRSGYEWITPCMVPFQFIIHETFYHSTLYTVSEKWRRGFGNQYLEKQETHSRNQYFILKCTSNSTESN
jgi:hypothetical protein